jgi:hypothetical protein
VQRRRGVLKTRAITNTSFQEVESSGGAAVTVGGGGATRELTLKEKAERKLIDEELEYLVFWVDITQFVQDRWGFVRDALYKEYTRLFEFNGVCVLAGFGMPRGEGLGLKVTKGLRLQRV